MIRGQNYKYAFFKDLGRMSKGLGDSSESANNLIKKIESATEKGGESLQKMLKDVGNAARWAGRGIGVGAGSAGLSYSYKKLTHKTPTERLIRLIKRNPRAMASAGILLTGLALSAYSRKDKK